MTPEPMRWDPSGPGFVPAVLRTVLVLWAGVTIIGILAYRPAFWGLVSGGVLAIALYLVAIQAGRVFIHTGNYARTMMWLMLSQFLLWVGSALLLAGVKVHPIGFVLGVSILPIGILLTLLWYTLQKKRLPS